ncbi:MAG: RNA polymerase sigma factor [Kiritimatiellia bacterium]
MRGREQQQIRAAAFEGVVHHYESRLLRYATSIVNNPDLAQDVVQDVFIRLFRKWRESFAPSAALTSWLYRTTHNCAVDVIRKYERRHKVEQEHQAMIPEPMVLHPAGENVAAGQRVSAALGALPARDRELVVLKVYEEKSYKEISAITGLSVGNVGYILHHAMRKLADALERA